jgi:hypothetical protein
MSGRIGGLAGACIVAILLTVSGCGSSSSTNSESTSAATTASAASSQSTSSPQSTGTSTTAASGTTAPGTTLALGAPAVVDYKPGIKSNSPTYHLRVSVASITKAPAADLNGVELEKEQQGKAPYYVKLSITNLGDGNASAEDGVPTAALQAIDDRGQQGQELTLLGTFRPCESGTQPKQFTRGVTYSTCQVYLVGGGGSIVKDEWTGSGDEYTEKPIVWKAG